MADAGDAAEGAAEGVEDKKGGGAATAGAAAGGAIAGGGVAAVALNRIGGQQGDEDEEVSKDGFEAEEDSKPRKSWVGAYKKVKNAASFISTTAKEQIATSLLGDGK
jgi:hypothetical protein